MVEYYYDKGASVDFSDTVSIIGNNLTSSMIGTQASFIETYSQPIIEGIFLN